jgi:hypothetical protein
LTTTRLVQISLCLLTSVVCGISTLHAQTLEYRAQHIRPDLWYNSVDGLQIGVRYFGYTDTGYSRAYQIKAGLWLNTFFPEVPVAYDLQFRHPLIHSRSNADQLSLSVESRFRDGLQRNFAGLQSLYQFGPDYDQVLRLYAGYFHYEQYALEHLVFPINWSTGIQNTIQAGAYLRNTLGGGYQTLRTDFLLGTGPQNHTLRLSGSTHHTLGTAIRMGVRLGSVIHTSADIRAEFATNLTYAQAWDWHDKAFFRSHGNLPVQMLYSGTAVTSSEFAGIRGYSRRDISRMRANNPSTIQQLHTVNLDLEWQNPLGKSLHNIPIAGPFLHLNTYLFADAGRVTHITTSALDSETLASAGAGLLFRINIPDYESASRGFTLRWDLPLWINSPAAGKSAIAFRHQLSFDIIIPF